MIRHAGARFARDKALRVAIDYEQALPSQRTSRGATAKLANVVRSITPTANDDDVAKRVGGTVSGFVCHRPRPARDLSRTVR